MNNPLLNALGKLPVFSGISYRYLTVDDPALPGAFVTMGVVPTTLVPSRFSTVVKLKIIVAFLNRTARDTTQFAASAPEVAILPASAFRTVAEVKFPNFLVVRVEKEIVEPETTGTRVAPGHHGDCGADYRRTGGTPHIRRHGQTYRAVHTHPGGRRLRQWPGKSKKSLTRASA